MRAAIYYRISTDKQDISMQEKVCRDYCERESITIYKEYSDKGISGSKNSRPEFDMMLQDMRAKLFDTIVCYKLDRIGRSVIHLLMMFEEFEKKGIKFISVTQSFNTTTPEGKLMLRMLMILAEYERAIIISRVNDGLAEAREKGKTLGRPTGAKDKKRRRLSGYIQRWSKGVKQSTPSKTNISSSIKIEENTK